MADADGVALIEDPRFAVGAAAGVMLFVLIVGVHAKACWMCAKHRPPELPELAPALRKPPSSTPRHESSKGRSTPSINEQEPLLGGALLSFNALSATSLPAPDDFSALSRLFLVWNFPLVYEGWGSPVQRDRIPGLPGRFKSTLVGARTARLWAKHSSRATRSPKHPQPGQILRATMWELLRPTLLRGSTVAFVAGLLSTVARPYILRKIINEIATEDIELDEAVMLIAILASVVFFEGWLSVLARHLLSDNVGTSMITALLSLILGKVVRGVDLAAAPGVNVANLVGNDTSRRFMDLMLASQLPLAMGSMSGGLAMVIFFIGWEPAVVGVSTIVVVMFGNVMIARKLGRIEKRNLEYADRRIGILGEIVGAIKAVKFFAWEEPYLGKITDVRVQELISIRSFRMWQVTSVSLGRSLPALAASAAIITYALLGKKLEPGDIFGTMAVFQSLRICLITIPHALAALETIKISLRRIDAFLTLPEKAPRKLVNPTDDPDSVVLMAGVSAGLKPTADKVRAAGAAIDLLQSLGVVEGSEYAQLRRKAAIAGGHALISDVCLSVRKGEIAAVVGPVGAGKTALISTLIGDLDHIAGSLYCHDEVGYVPQQAVVISGTILDNILFGRAYDALKLDAVLDAADFQYDVKAFPHRLATEIGERGTSLSGGQQQRLSIARALYGEPTLLILDDPLSAVDPEVCQRIFERAVLAFAERGGAVLMVANQLHLLSKCSSIFYLDGGRVVEQGTYPKLMAAPDSAFATLISKHVFADDNAGEKAKASSAHTAVDSAPAVAVDSKADKGELVKIGAVSTSIYLDFLRSMGWPLWAGAVSSIVGAYGAMAAMDVWLSIWIASDSDRASYGSRVPSAWLDLPRDTYIGVFVGTTALYMVLGLAGSLTYAIGGFRASRVIHFSSMQRMLYAPYSWFQDTPVGRIMSRFTTDLSFVDLQLSSWLDSLTQLGFQFIAMNAVVIWILPLAAVPVVLATCIYMFASTAVNRTNREIKREANQAMGPVQSNVAESVQASLIARVMRCEAFFTKRHHECADSFNRANFITYSLNSWMQLVGVYSSFVISVTIGAYVVAVKTGVPVEQTALLLTYTFLIPYFMSSLAMLVTNVMIYFTSLERIREFELLPQEPPHSLPADEHLGDWPAAGGITLSGLSLQYSADTAMVLKNVSVEFKPGKSIGVVGRTGAGKSSLMSVIFRIVSPTAGQVLIDGVDTQTVGLRRLREKITVIPQEPILMSGTVRYNLDPFGAKSEVELLQAMEHAQLAPALLDVDVDEAGEGLSMGQRQLLCFARAILHRTPILLMDEPTANCDLATDALIQAMVRTQFADTTVITIAHRLSTIIDYDHILVMGDGAVLEYGPAHELLADPRGHLTHMVAAMGAGAEGKLRESVGLPAAT